MPQTLHHPPAPNHSLLMELAALYGIQTAYVDASGQRQHASEAALRAALGALGAELERDPSPAIQARRVALGRQVIEPVLLAWGGRLHGLRLRLPRRSPLLQPSARWQATLRQENGATQTFFFSPDDFSITAHPELDATALCTVPLALRTETGYHELSIEATARRANLQGTATVIAAPVKCWAAPGRRKAWGVFLPLYALRSRGGWGVGDFDALRRLHQWVRARGGSWTGTLPLLATFLDEPLEPSPYMPVSRLFWNELYVAPELEPEFAASAEARRLTQSSGWREEVESLRRRRYADYAAAMRLKRRILEPMARQLLRDHGPRGEAFRRDVDTHPGLADYARFRAAVEKHGADWRRWPGRRSSGELRPGDVAAESELYHQYVQWVAERQVRRISAATQPGGLYLDFPLGVHPHGYDAWRHQQIFVEGAAAGAPPDELFADGQNWAFSPVHPEAIRRDGYRYLREALRHQMRHACMLRVDHVMGLNRLYWIPRGIATREGVYVHYQAEEMYAILCLESHRARCEVVGENLGTVPESVSRSMRRHGALGMHILQFGVRPARSRPFATPAGSEVACLNTHDMPPFAGFLAGRDIAELARLGVYSADQAAARKQARQALVAAMRAACGVGGQSAEAAYPVLLEKALRWLASSPARAVIVNLEDVWGERQPQNVPGTGPGTAHPEQPNWRRKASRSLERIAADDGIASLLESIFTRRNALRRSLV